MVDSPGLTLEEFVIYSSPRYYRLIFEDIKPKTKNGDLVSALNELKRARILTPYSHWDKVVLTDPCGITYRNLIEKLLQLQMLQVPQNNGLFDYRSESGRRAIVELIRFLAAKFDFTNFMNYLHIPLFDSEKNPEWMNLFGEDSNLNIDYESQDGRQKLVDYLQKVSKRHSRQGSLMHNTISHQNQPVQLNLKILKKFLQNHGLKRSEPLFNHFNSAVPPVFQIKERKFFVNLAELTKIKEILATYIINFENSENAWLNDYFKLLKLPTGNSGLFGFQVADEIQYASQTDAFLNLAVEGPRIFAGQFSSIEGLGELREIMFPINPVETLVISCKDLDLLYYFTIESEKCIFKIRENLISIKNFPEKYITSRKSKEFGKLVSRSRTLQEALLIQELVRETQDFKKKRLRQKLHQVKNDLQTQMENLSKVSASLITICQMICMKFNREFALTKTICIFEHGLINLVDIGGADQILTSVTMGEMDYGSTLKKTMEKIEKSLEEIVDLTPNSENI
ncbi:MAG: hypothetical protein DRO88_10080 [Promethearchaeia archaeon]|nr:MAG: hypothetical protein DRO88_10080 [Candidatus Lokiarchaeia archaeon]